MQLEIKINIETNATTEEAKQALAEWLEGKEFTIKIRKKPVKVKVTKAAVGKYVCGI